MKPKKRQRKAKDDGLDFEFAVAMVRGMRDICSGPAPSFSNATPDYRKGFQSALDAVVRGLEAFLPRRRKP